MAKRPGLASALEQLDADQADTLVVSKLDRLSRSLLDFAALVERSRRNGWTLVALDLAVDTTTPSGEMLANVLAAFAQFERRLIGQRTKEGVRREAQRRHAQRPDRPATPASRRHRRADPPRARCRNQHAEDRRRLEHGRNTNGARGRAMVAVNRRQGAASARRLGELPSNPRSGGLELLWRQEAFIAQFLQLLQPRHRIARNPRR